MNNNGFVKRSIGKARESAGMRRTCWYAAVTKDKAQRSIWTFYETGFTLLEIMVSLAIIGGLLVTVLYSLNYHLGIAEKHEFLTVATMLAKNKIAEIDQLPAATKGEFPDPYSGYHYETGIKDSSYPGISEIWVTVSKDGENVRLTELKETTKKTGG
jgi:general secretion pathway protein I